MVEVQHYAFLHMRAQTIEPDLAQAINNSIGSNGLVLTLLVYSRMTEQYHGNAKSLRQGLKIHSITLD